jgi:ABC-type Mn2+/Zn2+ transport system permease subunit
MLARNMRQFTILASLCGGVTAFAGFWVAYQLDLPVGPTDVVLLGGVHATMWAAVKLFTKRPCVSARS